MHSDDRREFIAKTLIATAGFGAASLAHANAEPSSQPAEKADESEPTWLVIYSRGPNWIEGKPMSQQGLRPHGQYMLQLYRAGKLKLAGGFGDDSGGAVAFSAADEAAATAIAKEDPAVIAGTFTFVLRRWNLVDWAAVDKRASGLP